MSLVRQDAWTQDEDLLLAEVVLRHIREGSTQLQAFEEVGRQMNRTAAACGFRWNSYVRKQYKSAIELAKKQRKERKQTKNDEEPLSAYESPVEAEYSQPEQVTFTLPAVINYLQKLHAEFEEKKHEQTELQRGVDDWKNKYAEVYRLYQTEKEKCMRLQQEYHSLLSFMDKARKLGEKEV
ncbi:RsfA family transcriptional regulator [Heyndrickxia ginsengihumi]|uniref:Transcriptional regulator n=1 Tax=Heyndrickxia ginsengihumi TaxID=363870 RepID=A0A0A6XX30_9BACI|nr:RsfA family transcriptional regulator [Heyndrickxia ginsengihumi]KHD84687.1 transcriptional regulator [Heyndrickxia ginsengihumi]MBE6183683.1 RsfA family transcriptional regulator [Bacillus sp. (in: firmicutes)]NEY18665.1 RsfA family transcriptional regulator [Heyndrickxia ginsengihumi]